MGKTVDLQSAFFKYTMGAFSKIGFGLDDMEYADYTNPRSLGLLL